MAATYTNAVIASNAPDPGVLDTASHGYVLTHTGGNEDGQFPVYTSPDLVDWTYVAPALAESTDTSWAASDFWAPEIHPSPDGEGYLLLHTARTTEGRLCLGVAKSMESPTGPFTESRELLCNEDDPSGKVGFIDSTLYVDDDSTPWLVWKVDGNAGGKPTVIEAAPLSADGMSLRDGASYTPIELIRNDLAWEASCTEGPWLLSFGDWVYLFYSGSMYNTVAYSVGVARANGIEGPWEKRGDPILHVGNSSSSWGGPGHCSVVAAGDGDDDLWMVYHAHVGYSGDTDRYTLLDRLAIDDDGWPVMAAGETPTEDAQQRPV